MRIESSKQQDAGGLMLTLNSSEDVRKAAVGVIILIALVVTAFLLVRASASRQQEAVLEDRERSTSEVVETPATTTTPTTPTVPALPPISGEAVGMIEEAIRIYGSYPNPDGRTATLQRLEAFVSQEALQETSQKWAGSEVNTATYTVLEVTVDENPLPLSTDSETIIEVVALQEATFTSTPAIDYLTHFFVTLGKVDGTWKIVHIEELS